MLKLYTPAEAKETILRRDNWLERPVPASVAEGMERIFGERLTPEEGVMRIVEDVRRRGDEALRHWSERIDGTTIETFRVPKEAIAAAAATIPAELFEAL